MSKPHGTGNDVESHAFSECRRWMGLERGFSLPGADGGGYGTPRATPRNDDMNLDRQAAIQVRAHQLWEESGHAHGQDEQHWRQAEREYDEVEARIAAVEQFAAETAGTAPAKLIKKRATKAAEPMAEISEAPARKARAPRRTAAAAALS